MKTPHQLNQQQYQDKSEAYLKSTVHAQGLEFEKIVQWLKTENLNQVLDLGCGGGHVTYHVAPYVEQVIAYDLTQAMLDTVQAQASHKKLTNIRTQQGAAEQLPFLDDSMDAVISRYSAHHWHNLAKALSEIYRVVQPGGKIIFIDVLGNQNPILDTFLQAIELIRDPSHVRDYSLSEWIQSVEFAGFKVEQVEKQNLFLDFNTWVERMSTPAQAVATLRYLQKTAADPVKNYFVIQEDGSFQSEVMYLVITKPLK